MVNDPHYYHYVHRITGLLSLLPPPPCSFYHNVQTFKEVLENIHPADILDILHEDEDSSKEILEHLPNEVIGDILDEEDDEELILEWLNLFSKYKQKQILDEVSHDVLRMLSSSSNNSKKAFFSSSSSIDPLSGGHNGNSEDHLPPSVKFLFK